MRSTSSTNMANMTQSMYSTSKTSENQNFPSNHQRRSSEREMNGGAKRATSVHALDQSAEIDERRHKIWTRQSTFAGGPTVIKSTGGAGSNTTPIRPRPVNASYGFGSRNDRFCAIQSTPSSPMVETNPLK